MSPPSFEPQPEIAATIRPGALDIRTLGDSITTENVVGDFCLNDFTRGRCPSLILAVSITTVRLKYIATICKEVELFRGIPVGRFLQRVPVQIEDFEQGEV